jgi:hypothetical protein
MIPRFHVGALALLDGTRPENNIWHILTTQPRNQPFRQLGSAIDDASKGLGLSPADRDVLVDGLGARTWPSIVAADARSTAVLGNTRLGFALLETKTGGDHRQTQALSPNFTPLILQTLKRNRKYRF